MTLVLPNGVQRPIPTAFCSASLPERGGAVAEGENMYVAVVTFPPIRPGHDQDFRAWFDWSTQVLHDAPGFVSRRLLVPIDGGPPSALVEHESRETFGEMQSTPLGLWVHRRLMPLVEADAPQARHYEAEALPCSCCAVHDVEEQAAPADSRLTLASVEPRGTRTSADETCESACVQ